MKRGSLPHFGYTRRLCIAILLPALTLVWAIAPPARAQIDGIGEPVDPGPAFLVSRFTVRYADPHPDQPPLDRILPLTVRLGTTRSGFVAPHPDRPSTTIQVGGPAGAALPYHSGAIGAVARALLVALQREGLLGVYVEPDPSDLDVENERDLRPAGDTELALVVTTARVRALRTIASGDRVKSEWLIDNEIHDRIRRHSPIQPTGADSDDTTDLVDADRLDDYLFRLNRHPGRRVDAALAPAEDGKGVSLDYLVTESKPWYVYAQVSNTGTSATSKYQQRFGYVNDQLLDRDDTLTFEYFRAGLDDLNGVSFSYEAPWFDSDRPWWWSTPADGPDWLAWLDRSKLPWFGNDFLRWRLFGSYTNSQIEVPLEEGEHETVQDTDWNVGTDLIYNVFQYRSFFLDVFGGVEGRGVTIDNDAAVSKASRFFLLPQGGLEAERVNPLSSFFANLTFSGSVTSARITSVEEGGNPAGGLQALGRANPDDKWLVMTGDLGISQYLEPLLNPSGWDDPSTARSSTLAHEIAIGARGQYAFGYRLIPQAEQVVGGLYSVRGYDQSAAVGDNVVIGSFEYRFHLPHALPVDREPAHLPLFGDFRVAPQQVYGRPDWDFILRAFVDAGATSSNKRLDRDPMTGIKLEPSEFLMGAGLGAELRIRNNFTARVDWATALKSTQSTTNQTDAGDQQVNFLFTILY